MNDIELKEIIENYNLSYEDLSNITATEVRTVKSWVYNERKISKSAAKLIEIFCKIKEGDTQCVKEFFEINTDKKRSSYKELPDINKFDYLYEENERLKYEILKLKTLNEKMKYDVDQGFLLMDIYLSRITKHFNIEVPTLSNIN